MKTLLLLVALFLVATPVFAHPDFPSGTVRIYVYEDNDAFPDSYGSGAVISPTQVLTNWHVVKDRRKNNPIKVRFSDGSRRAAIVVASNKKWDIVILKIHSTQAVPFILGNRPQVGEKAIIHGFGFDYEYVSGEGTVSNEVLSPSDSDVDDFFQIKGVAARKGDSGGPITDHNGHLIGILFASNVKDKYTLGVMVDRIRKVFGSKLQPHVLTPSPYHFKDQP